jgi:hypothetical protein
MSDTSTSEAESDGGAADLVAFWGSVVFGLALAAGSVWFFSGQGLWHETLLRVRPTLAGGGVGADWEAGIASTLLNALIELIHIADVVMGIFILLMVFVHWMAFHRLADRMQPPQGRDETASETTVADGGERE